MESYYYTPYDVFVDEDGKLPIPICTCSTNCSYVKEWEYDGRPTHIPADELLDLKRLTAIEKMKRLLKDENISG